MLGELTTWTTTVYNHTDLRLDGLAKSLATFNTHSVTTSWAHLCIRAHFTVLTAQMLPSFSMFIQALPIKWICKSALRSRKNAKLGFIPLSISVIHIAPTGGSSKTRVKSLDLLPSLNIIQDGQGFNKCTLQKESMPILTSRPPSLRVSIQYDKVKQTAGPWQRC